MTNYLKTKTWLFLVKFLSIWTTPLNRSNHASRNLSDTFLPAVILLVTMHISVCQGTANQRRHYNRIASKCFSTIIIIYQSERRQFFGGSFNNMISFILILNAINIFAGNDYKNGSYFRRRPASHFEIYEYPNAGQFIMD